MRLSLVLGLLLASTLLAGCPKQQSTGGDSAGETSTSSDTAATDAPAADAPATDGAADNPVEQQQHADAAPDKVPQGGPDSTEAEMKEPRDLMTGPEVFKAGNCQMCHGADLNGTPLGPPLKNIKQYDWDAVKLVGYFKDPATYAANDPRLSANKDKYSVPMPPQRLPDAQLNTLAEWLLEQ